MKSFIQVFLIAVLLLTGVAEAQYTAVVRWGASTTTGIAGYKIYRANCLGTISQTSCNSVGSFSLVGATTDITYPDYGLAPAQKLVYRVTSYCPDGGCSDGSAGESIPSELYAVITPADTTPPIVSITAPLAGSYSGILTILAGCTDEIGIAGVTFKYTRPSIGTVTLGREVIVGPYSTSLDLRSLPNGPYLILATCRDTSNNTATTSVLITNTSGPATPPAHLGGSVK